MAFTFNGTTQYLSAAASPIASSPSVFTMAAWANGAAQDGRLFFALGSSSNTSPIIGMGTGATSISQSTDSLRPFVRLNSGTFPFGNLTAECISGLWNSTWKHAAMSFDGTDFKAYANGVNSLTKAGTLGALDTNRTAIGALLRASPILYFGGQVAEAAIWNVALTDAEVDSLAHGVTPDQIRPQSLVFYAPIVRNLQELKGALTITNNNTATVSDHPRAYA